MIRLRKGGGGGGGFGTERMVEGWRCKSGFQIQSFISGKDFVIEGNFGFLHMFSFFCKIVKGICNIEILCARNFFTWNVLMAIFPSVHRFPFGIISLFIFSIVRREQKMKKIVYYHAKEINF